jgi:hypothetical protein
LNELPLGACSEPALATFYFPFGKADVIFLPFAPLSKPAYFGAN